MERNKCKLCLRSFANGRALGGHMRSHMVNLQVPAKPEEEEEEEERGGPSQLGEEPDSASTSSSSSEEEEENGEEKGLLYYGLRENPKRSIKLVDPEFSFATIDAGSVVLQDRESETESSKNNPTRRRSMRKIRNSTSFLDHPYCHHNHLQRQEQDVNIKKLKLNHNNNTNVMSKTESWTEPEPVSSISDTTTEEHVAFCLMMLSRDHKWKKKETQQQQQQQRVHEDQDQDPDDDYDDDEEEEEEQEAETEESEENETKFCKTRSRGKYKCETCNKVFKSYQALGGHRASHKKMKVINTTATAATTTLTTATTNHQTQFETENAGTSGSVLLVPEKKIHECPVCFRVFSSGQALGGHKRTHVIGVVAAKSATATTATTTTPTNNKSASKFGDNNWIDLNLPAPIDDDDNFSQIELSAVSDAEFVNHIRR